MTAIKTPREDQAAAINRLRESIAAGKRRIIMQGATGYGKTMVASMIIEGALAKNKRVLFTVPAISLVDQTVEAFYHQGITDVGVIQASRRTDYGKPVQIASVQTLMRREIPQADLVLIDEVHVFFKLYEKLLLDPDRRHIINIGMSATPYTKGLGKYFEELVVVGTTADLIEKGILSKFKVFAPSHPDLKGVRTLAGDYHEGDLGEAMNKKGLVADIVQTWLKLGENRPTICFAVNRLHAKTISEQFEASGVGAGYLDCESTIGDRNEVRAKFLRGEIRVVCNVDVIGMGVDWPEVSCVIYARPTKSEMRFVQNIGRALRTAPGKDYTIILDHSDTHLRLGFVTDISHADLDDGKPKDAAAPQIALPKECPACAYLKPPRCAVCPNCGHKAEVKLQVTTKAGSLEEIAQASKAAAKFGDKRAVYGQLNHYAKERGYKSGWVANKYRDLFGVWPRGMEGAPHRAPSMELASWIKSTQIRWAKGKGKGESREVRDQRIIENVKKQFVDGTLCTEEDMAVKW